MGKIKNFYEFGPIKHTDRLKENFEKFTTVILRRLYHKHVHNGLDFIDDSLFDEDDIALYLENKDEKCLNDPEFSKVIMGKKDNIIKQLGMSTKQIFIERDYFFVKGEVTLGISYIPAPSIDCANIIRLDICEELNKGKSFINGYIDIYGDDQIKIGTFDEMIYSESFDKKGNKTISGREFSLNIKQTSMDIEAIDDIKEYIIHLLKLANLNKEVKQKTKR